MTFLQRISGVCMTNARRTAMTKIIRHPIVSDPLMIIKVRYRYAVTTLYTPNVRRNHLELQRIHGNTTVSNAHVAVTLHDRLVLLERHGNATTSRAYHLCSMIASFAGFRWLCKNCRTFVAASIRPTYVTRTS